MKAIVQRRYGPPDEVLQLEEIERPAPKPDEVLVRVKAASLHPDVWHVVTGRPYVLRLMGAGLRRPKTRIPGTDVAGIVEAVGDKVTRFKPGDKVFGETRRGHQWANGGAFAEFVCAPEDALATIPSGLTFEAAASVPTSGYIALMNVRDQGQVHQGQKVLVNGAAGGVGLFVVQLSKAFGAEVTAVDRGAKAEMLRSIGADHVIDFETDDFTTNGIRYDVIIDIPGNRSVKELRRALTKKGSYVLIGHDQFGKGAGRWFGSIGHFLKLVIVSPFVTQQFAPRTYTQGTDHFEVLVGLLKDGKIRPVIDRTFPLSDAKTAMAHLQSGTARGKIVLMM